MRALNAAVEQKGSGTPDQVRGDDGVMLARMGSNLFEPSIASIQRHPLILSLSKDARKRQLSRRQDQPYRASFDGLRMSGDRQSTQIGGPGVLRYIQCSGSNNLCAPIDIDMEDYHGA